MRMMANYSAYMQSETWRLKRGIVIRVCNYQCQMCGVRHDFRNRLQVHHYHYKNLGNEPIEDLVALCKRCHKIADKERLTHPEKRYKYERQTRQQNQRIIPR